MKIDEIWLQIFRLIRLDLLVLDKLETVLNKLETVTLVWAISWSDEVGRYWHLFDASCTKITLNYVEHISYIAIADIKSSDGAADRKLEAKLIKFS